MATYRKIATVEAFKFISYKGEYPEGIESDGESWYINTLEGKMRFYCGDYICTGIDGEKWAVKKDIFERTYELVDEN